MRVFTDGESSFRDAKFRRASLVAYKALADALGKGSIFVITVVAARALTPWEFGVFGLGTTLGWMLSVVADFGMQMHVARAVAQTPELAAALLHRWWRLRALATAASVGVLLIALLAARADSSFVVPLAAFAAAYACTSLVEFLNYFYRGLSRSDVESTLTIAQRFATLALAIAVLVWRPNVTLLALAMLAPSAVALAWSLRFASALAGDLVAAGLAPPRDTFRRDVFPIGLGIVLSALYFRIDVMLVQWWVGTEAVAGYNAVFRVIDALRLFPAALMAVVLPSLCRADSLRPLARIGAGALTFGIVTAAALWITADRLIPTLFGTPYAATVPAFRVLALSFPLLSLNLALTHQLVGWNLERRYAAICGAALAANLALNAWLIPQFAIVGASWATVGTEVCLTAGCAVALGARS